MNSDRGRRKFSESEKKCVSRVMVSGSGPRTEGRGEALWSPGLLGSTLCETLVLHDIKNATLGRTRDRNLQLRVESSVVVVSSRPHRAEPACFPAAKRLNEFINVEVSLDIFKGSVGFPSIRSAFPVSAAYTNYKA